MAMKLSGWLTEVSAGRTARDVVPEEGEPGGVPWSVPEDRTMSNDDQRSSTWGDDVAIAPDGSLVPMPIDPDSIPEPEPPIPAGLPPAAPCPVCWSPTWWIPKHSDGQPRCLGCVPPPSQAMIDRMLAVVIVLVAVEGGRGAKVAKAAKAVWADQDWCVRDCERRRRVMAKVVKAE